MRSLIPLAIPVAIFLAGLAYTSNYPIEADNNSYQLIELLPEVESKNPFFGDNEIKITANAAIGGTNNGIDYPMTFPEVPEVIEENYDWGGSRIKGIKYDKNNSDGLLTVLLITDYSFHHHIDILGSVIMLSPDLEEDKNCNGNKDHWVYYSSEAIENATGIGSEITGLSGRVGYGFGKKRVDVKHVYE